MHIPGEENVWADLLSRWGKSDIFPAIQRRGSGDISNDISRGEGEEDKIEIPPAASFSVASIQLRVRPDRILLDAAHTHARLSDQDASMKDDAQWLSLDNIIVAQ